MAPFTYADAVKLLGGNENKIVRTLDNILGTALLGGSVLSVLDLLSWFDAKGEFIRLSKELVAKVAEKRTGGTRFDQTQRLHAAHSVIVVVAFFEALDELNVPFTTKSLDLTKERQLALQSETVTTIHDAPVPLLSPEQSYEVFLTTLKTWYDDLALSSARLIQGLALWDGLTETVRTRHLEILKEGLPVSAVRRYEELLRRLAIDCPEVAFWSAKLDAQATHSQLSTVGVALQRLSDSLSSLTIGESPTAQRQELALTYQSALNHPILESDDAPGGLTIPLLKDSYIDPFFQVANDTTGEVIAQKSWWDTRPVWADMHRFLTGYLTSPNAWTAPLVVLGDPGSGKSVLTKVFAARLPASDFLVVRVELRNTPADADILDQIEHALKGALKEDVSWPSLLRSAPQALPVVLLDGFDELLQATGVNQTDYLTKIARFQRERSDVNRPVAFVVTSRISVANRATLPSGSVVVRLTEFTEGQKEKWLEVWRRSNAAHFEKATLKPLDLPTAQRYSNLSEHPLLLLMLALYDAEGNPLQQAGPQIDQAELYERLLIRFARREVTKDGEHRTDVELAQAVEDELERLSIVAFAMFNRGNQWVTESDLTKDLAVFLDREQPQVGIRSALSAGVIALGRFFFVQRSQAMRDSQALHTYEFLHATFGEFLVARHIWKVLSDLPNRPVSRRSAAVDDSELYALLSFVPLSKRSSIISFLSAMTDDSALGDLVAELFRTADQHHGRQRYADYAPLTLSMPERFAVYRANLLILTVMLKRVVQVSELSGESKDVVRLWNRHTRLWKAHLSYQDWESFVFTFTLSRVWGGHNRDIELRLASDHEPLGIPPLDAEWWQGFRLHPEEVGVIYEALSPREIHFTCEWSEDFMWHALEPIEVIFSDGPLVGIGASGRSMTQTHAMLGLLFSDPTNRFDQQDFLKTLDDFNDCETNEIYSRVVFGALYAHPDDFDLAMLASHDWIANDPRFWSLLCHKLGTGLGHDTELLILLTQCWDEGSAFSLIPADVLDAWLRLAEGGFEVHPPAPSLQRVLEATLDTLEDRRPDLIKRAGNLLAEREG